MPTRENTYLGTVKADATNHTVKADAAGVTWQGKAVNKGDTTATLTVIIDIDGVPMPAGELAAFNSKDALIGTATASHGASFPISISNPRFADSSDTSVSLCVTFKFSTGSDTSAHIIDLATTYSYSANDISDITLNDFEPCGTCTHYMMKPSVLKSAKKDASSSCATIASCVPGNVNKTFKEGPTEAAQDPSQCYMSTSKGVRQCAAVEGETIAYSYEVTSANSCLKDREYH